MKNMYKEEMEALFRQVFQQEADIIVRSPGRINIMGEHTDYNEGFVLPAAIDKAVMVALRKRSDDGIRLYANEFSEHFSVSLAAIRPLKKWTDYILGVVDELVKRGYTIHGFELLITGNIPIGAGLSSSAAVECAGVFALNELFELGIEKMDLVHIARQAEHSYAGVQCGIMDQFASMFGKKDQVIRLDCRSLEYEYLPLDMKDTGIVLFNSNVKHSLASSEYNMRKQQCEEGIGLIKQKYPGVNSLRDVTLSMLDECVRPVNTLIDKRCRYVVAENSRLLASCLDLMRGNIAALGQKMLQTHQGLSKDFEVSCPELDTLIDLVKDEPSVWGARMIGGGFGGCTINLVKKESIDEVVSKTGKAYKQRTGLLLDVYMASAENGTSVI